MNIDGRNWRVFDSQPLNYIFYSELVADLSSPDVEGIYETNVKPELRALIQLGCMCSVVKEVAKKISAADLQDIRTFSLEQLEMKNLPYLGKVTLF